MKTLDFDNKQITVVGDVMLDIYIMGNVHRVAPEAPVPVVEEQRRFYQLGGAGNVAVNLANLGIIIKLFGVCGEDSAREILFGLIGKHGIEGAILADESIPTTTKTRVFAQRQQLVRYDKEEFWKGSDRYRNMLMDKIDLALLGSDAVILSDYDKGVLSIEYIQQIIARCKTKNIPVFIDPKRGGWNRYSMATFMTPNLSELEEEIQLDIGQDEGRLLKYARRVKRKYSIEKLLITRGQDGMCCLDGSGEPILIKSQAKEVFDVSGAGDTTISVLAACIASGYSLSDSVSIANIAAGIVVGKVGVQPVNKKELEAQLK